MAGGHIIVNGTAGEHTGENMSGGAIFVKGEVRSLGLNARSSKPSAEDLDKLRYLHKQYRFRAVHDDEEFGEFQKITAEQPRPLVGEAPR
jgi:glutamate synthase domain-containing protein 3